MHTTGRAGSCGRVFADTIKWLAKKQPGSIALLKDNLRQLLNFVEGKGTAILRLAELFISANARDNGEATPSDAEELIAQVHKGGEVDADLRVIYWDEPTTLSGTLIGTIEREMAAHTAQALNPERPYELWRAAFDWKPEKYQILTPHRGDLHGVEALNESIQDRVATRVISRFGLLDGITLYDKVIQYRNRPQSNPIWAYNCNTRRSEYVVVLGALRNDVIRRI